MTEERYPTALEFLKYLLASGAECRKPSIHEGCYIITKNLVAEVVKATELAETR